MLSGFHETSLYNCFLFLRVRNHSFQRELMQKKQKNKRTAQGIIQANDDRPRSGGNRSRVAKDETKPLVMDHSNRNNKPAPYGKWQ